MVLSFISPPLYISYTLPLNGPVLLKKSGFIQENSGEVKDGWKRVDCYKRPIICDHGCSLRPY